MNLEDLRAVQSDERGTDSLQPLPDSFYRDVAAYVEGLRAERERAAERADSPFDSEEVRRLTDEIETAEEVVEAIYERRVGKVVKRASLAAAGMPADDEGLTDEESELFADMVSSIEANRRQVFAALEGESDSEAGAAEPAPRSDPDPADGDGLGAGDVMGAGTDGSGTGASPEADGPAVGTGSETGDPEVGEPDGATSGRDPTPAGNTRPPDPAGGDADTAPAGTGGDADAAPAGTGEPADTAGERPAPPDEPPADGGDPEWGDGERGETDPVSESGADAAPDPERAPAPGRGAAPSDRGSGGETGERVTLRITRDVGEIFGVDERTYTLGEEDVVTLPVENAEPLLERDAAQKLE